MPGSDQLLIDSMSPEPAGIPEMKLFLKVYFLYPSWLTASDGEPLQLGGMAMRKAVRTANPSAKSNVLS